MLMLTTIDNPYDPWTQFDEWYAYDESKGYHSCAYLARIAKTSDEWSEEQEEEAIDEAIKEICQLNINGMYKAVSKSS